MSLLLGSLTCTRMNDRLVARPPQPPDCLERLDYLMAAHDPPLLRLNSPVVLHPCSGFSTTIGSLERVYDTRSNKLVYQVKRGLGPIRLTRPQHPWVSGRGGRTPACWKTPPLCLLLGNQAYSAARFRVIARAIRTKRPCELLARRSNANPPVRA